MSAANSVLDSCESTNDLARKLGEQGCPHGTWVSARRQEKGRGRLGRSWASLEGNLFLSVVVRVPDQALWTWVPLAAATSVAAELRRRLPAADVRVKWPNDLWISGAKLGGILCEAAGGRTGSFIVVGLGLNCSAAPEGLEQPAVCLADAAGKAVTADELRLPLSCAIAEGVSALGLEGPARAAGLYEGWSALRRGDPVRWSGGTGTVEGLGPAGELVVIGTDGGRARLFAEDVSAVR